MKCLENLSLVPDECLKDLQKDIEATVNSYINISQSCLDIYDDIKDKLNKYDIIGIANELTDDWFFEGPFPVYQYYDFQKMIARMLDNFDGEDEAIAADLYNIMGTNCNLDPIDFDSGKKYWFYRDGANWEAWLVEEEYFKTEIRTAIEWHMHHEEELNILRKLKEIQRRQK